MANPPADEKSSSRGKAKLSHPDAFLDELDGDASQDPDALLAEISPSIEKEMSQLNTDFTGLNLEIESLDLDGEEEAEAPINFKDRWLAVRRKWKSRFNDFGARLFYHIKYFFIWLVLEAPKKLLKIGKSVAAKLNSIVQVYAKWSKKRKVLFLISTVGLSLVSYGYYQLVKSKILYKESFHFYGSMEEIADYSFSIEDDALYEPFYNSPRVKAYSFQLKPVVVNLRRKNPDRENPMGFFEFVFEGNSGDVVVEMKSRESEFVDIVGRVIEGHTYESLETPEGKMELKENLRRELNKQLTEGIVRRVEISKFFIKP